MLAEIKQLVTGAVNTLRGSFDNCAVTQDGHARYQEAVQRGNVYMTANQSGVTSQAGLSGTTPVLSLFNPKGNNKNLVLLYAGAVEIVATATTHVVWLAANVNIAAAAVTGTVATITNALVGNGNSPSASAFTAATLPATPIAIAMIGTVGTVAVTSWAQAPSFGRYFDGTVIVAPGGALSIQTSAASGASGLLCEFIWEEIPFSA